MTRPGELTKPEAAYRPAELLGVNCASCANRQEDTSCKVVEGVTSELMFCDSWALRDSRLDEAIVDDMSRIE